MIVRVNGQAMNLNDFGTVTTGTHVKLISCDMAIWGVVFCVPWL